MYGKIREKLRLLESRKPYSEQCAAFIKETDRIDWIYSCLRLSGNPMSKETVQRILRGELVTEVALSEHLKIHSHVDAMKRLEDMKEMRYDLLCDSGIRALYQAVFGEEPEYRRRNLELPQWDHLPPDCRRLEKEMNLLYSEVSLWKDGALLSDGSRSNPLFQACMMHMRLLAVYPFGEESEELARYAMLYQMMCAGLPVTAIPMSEQEYNTCVMHFMKSNDILPFDRVMERAVYNKLEVMLQITAEDER